MIKLFAAGGSKIGVGLLVMIVTFSFAIIAIADGLLLMKVRHKNSFLYALISFEYIFYFNMSYDIFFESSGFARVGLLSTNKVVGVMMIILGCLWSLISLVAVLLTIRV
jgi:hypothetical protein